MDEIILFITKHWMLSLAFAGLLVALLINELRHFSTFKSYSSQEVVIKMNHEHAKLVDCREAAAFQAGHILGAVNIPNQKLEESQSILTKFKSKPIIIVCHQGTDSPKMGAKLRKLGYEDVAMLEGGIEAWKKEGLPVERG